MVFLCIPLLLQSQQDSSLAISFKIKKVDISTEVASELPPGTDIIIYEDEAPNIRLELNIQKPVISSGFRYDKISVGFEDFEKYKAPPPIDKESWENISENNVLVGSFYYDETVKAEKKPVLTLVFQYDGAWQGTKTVKLPNLVISPSENPATSTTATDQDQDGVLDADDECPNDKGPQENKGCPESKRDSDNDKVPDDEDQCPDTYGRQRAHGCPDDDGDGTKNSIDLCPDVFGPRSNDGCPIDTLPDDAQNFNEVNIPPASADVDSDGDGVVDTADSCRLVPGKYTDGCPFTGNIKIDLNNSVIRVHKLRGGVPPFQLIAWNERFGLIPLFKNLERDSVYNFGLKSVQSSLLKAGSGKYYLRILDAEKSYIENKAIAVASHFDRNWVYYLGLLVFLLFIGPDIINGLKNLLRSKKGDSPSNPGSFLNSVRRSVSSKFGIALVLFSSLYHSGCRDADAFNTLNAAVFSDSLNSTAVSKIDANFKLIDNKIKIELKHQDNKNVLSDTAEHYKVRLIPVNRVGQIDLKVDYVQPKQPEDELPKKIVTVLDVSKSMNKNKREKVKVLGKEIVDLARNEGAELVGYKFSNGYARLSNFSDKKDWFEEFLSPEWKNNPPTGMKPSTKILDALLQIIEVEYHVDTAIYVLLLSDGIDDNHAIRKNEWRNYHIIMGNALRKDKYGEKLLVFTTTIGSNSEATDFLSFPKNIDIPLMAAIPDKTKNTNDYYLSESIPETLPPVFKERHQWVSIRTSLNSMNPKIFTGEQYRIEIEHDGSELVLNNNKIQIGTPFSPKKLTSNVSANSNGKNDNAASNPIDIIVQWGLARLKDRFSVAFIGFAFLIFWGIYYKWEHPKSANRINRLLKIPVPSKHLWPWFGAWGGYMAYLFLNDFIQIDHWAINYGVMSEAGIISGSIIGEILAGGMLGVFLSLSLFLAHQYSTNSKTLLARNWWNIIVMALVICLVFFIQAALTRQYIDLFIENPGVSWILAGLGTGLTCAAIFKKNLYYNGMLGGMLGGFLGFLTFLLFFKLIYADFHLFLCINWGEMASFIIFGSIIGLSLNKNLYDSAYNKIKKAWT